MSLCVVCVFRRSPPVTSVAGSRTQILQTPTDQSSRSLSYTRRPHPPTILLLLLYVILQLVKSLKLRLVDLGNQFSTEGHK